MALTRKNAQLRRNVTILRCVLQRIHQAKSWFSARSVAAGIDHSVGGNFVPPPALRMLTHLLEQGYLVHEDRRYYVANTAAREYLRSLSLPSPESESILRRFAAAGDS